MERFLAVSHHRQVVLDVPPGQQTALSNREINTRLLHLRLRHIYTSATVCVSKIW